MIGFLWTVLLCTQKATRSKAKKVLEAMVNPYVTLGMACLSPLLECINSLVKLAQARNSFICDFVTGLACCQVQYQFLNLFSFLYMLNQFPNLFLSFYMLKLHMHLDATGRYSLINHGTLAVELICFFF
jgi:hypothetical protein